MTESQPSHNEKLPTKMARLIVVYWSFVGQFDLVLGYCNQGGL
jgi:hypothetical protein